MFDVLRANLLSPIPLAFALGVFARVVRSELSISKDLYQSLALYLLLALGIKGGVELSHATFAQIAAPAGVTLALGALTPVSAYALLRRLGGFSVSDSAGIAAHYGSVSAVTFIAAQQFANAAGTPPEGFMTTLLTLLESPGIHVALAIGVLGTARGSHDFDWREELREILTGRTMILLVGGLVIGWLMGEHGWKSIETFYDGCFKGALVLFLLEMGMVAGSRLGDLKKTGPFLVAFGVLLPIAHGLIGVLLGHWAGLSVGGCAVLAAMAASASYIAAPPAVRTALPDANPTYSLTLALAITFPFNILFGIPLYYRAAQMLAS